MYIINNNRKFTKRETKLNETKLMLIRSKAEKALFLRDIL